MWLASGLHVGSVFVLGPCTGAGSFLPLKPLTSWMLLPLSKSSCGKPADTNSVSVSPALSFVPDGGEVRKTVPLLAGENAWTSFGTMPFFATAAATEAAVSPAASAGTAPPLAACAAAFLAWSFAAALPLALPGGAGLAKK